jgi:hypothetical protein
LLVILTGGNNGGKADDAATAKDSGKIDPGRGSIFSLESPFHNQKPRREKEQSCPVVRLVLRR